MPDAPEPMPDWSSSGAHAADAEAAPLAWEALPDSCWRLASSGFAMNSGLSWAAGWRP